MLYNTIYMRGNKTNIGGRKTDNTIDTKKNKEIKDIANITNSIKYNKERSIQLNEKKLINEKKLTNENITEFIKLNIDKELTLTTMIQEIRFTYNKNGKLELVCNNKQLKKIMDIMLSITYTELEKIGGNNISTRYKLTSDNNIMNNEDNTVHNLLYICDNYENNISMAVIQNNENDNYLKKITLIMNCLDRYFNIKEQIDIN